MCDLRLFSGVGGQINAVTAAAEDLFCVVIHLDCISCPASDPEHSLPSQWASEVKLEDSLWLVDLFGFFLFFLENQANVKMVPINRQKAVVVVVVVAVGRKWDIKIAGLN